MTGRAVIRVENLSAGFRGPGGEACAILRDITLSLEAGETLGLVGESGCGKSTLALALMGYLDEGLEVFSGSVWFEGQDILALPETARRRLRGKHIALIPQNAGRALTPTLRVRDQIDEALRLHTPLNAAQRSDRLEELLHTVRLPGAEQIAGRYPHQLSGGQLQRVAIAMALGSGARVLILDEPTTGLDVTTQAHILTFLKDLTEEARVTTITVSHDLGVIAQVARRVAVMYAGEIVEMDTTPEILSRPAHPYPRALLASIPRPGAKGLAPALDGVPPLVGARLKGCAFAPRCPIAQNICHLSAPPFTSLGEGAVRCFFPDAQEGAVIPRVDLPVSGHTGSRVLEAQDISVGYDRPGFFDRLFRRPFKPCAVNEVSITLHQGETLGLVGESGSGKSTILRAVAGLTAPKTGTVALAGTPVAASVSNRTLDTIKPLQMVFQDADSALNPRQTVRQILQAPLRLYFDLSPDETARRLAELLEAVRLPDIYLDRFPGQLSGGEKQRIGIARAFAAMPHVVLCDEITSALDVSVQAAVLRLLMQLQAARQTGFVFVSHDLAVVSAVSDRIAVLYQGRLCELGPAEAVFAPPFHPYTQILLGAILTPDPQSAPQLLADDTIDNVPPASGCPFQNRCPHKSGPICDTTQPPERLFAKGHRIKCHLDTEALRGLHADRHGDIPANGPFTEQL